MLTESELPCWCISVWYFLFYNFLIVLSKFLVLVRWFQIFISCLFYLTFLFLLDDFKSQSSNYSNAHMWMSEKTMFFYTPAALILLLSHQSPSSWCILSLFTGVGDWWCREQLEKMKENKMESRLIYLWKIPRCRTSFTLKRTMIMIMQKMHGGLINKMMTLTSLVWIPTVCHLMLLQKKKLKEEQQEVPVLGWKIGRKKCWASWHSCEAVKYTS